MFNKKKEKSSTSSSSSTKKGGSSAASREQDGYSDDLDLSTSKETLHLKDPDTWNLTDVIAWLENLELSEYKRQFWTNHISGAALLELSEDDLKNLQVNKLGQRKKLLKEIEKLKGSNKGSKSSSKKRGGDKNGGAESGSDDGVGSSGSSNNERLYFKLHYKDDVQGIKVPQSISLKELRQEVKALFNQRMRIKYKDDEGDLVSLRREADLSALIREMQVENKRTMKFYLTPTEVVSTAEKEKADAVKTQMFALFDIMLDPVVIINESGIVQYMNAAGESLTGYKPNELIGSNVSKLMTDEYAKYHDGYLKNYLKTKQSKIIGNGRDVVLQKKDGGIVAIRLEVTEKLVGEKLYFFGTLKKAAENAPVKSMLQQEREVLDTLIVPAVIIDEKGTIHGFNPAASKFLGYSLVEVINKNVNMLMLSPDKEKHDNYLQRYIETGKSKILGVGRKVIASAKDGSLKTVFLSVTEKKDKDKRLFTGILQDLEGGSSHK